MNKILLFMVMSVLASLFVSTAAYAKTGDKELTIGYEVFTEGISGELTTGLNFGLGYYIEEDAQIKLDVMHQIYNAWDVTLTGVNLMHRSYARVIDQDDKLKIFFQLGLGYYWVSCNTCDENSIESMAIVPGAGLVYMVAPNIGVGIEARHNVFINQEIPEDINNLFLTLNYSW